MPDRIGEGVGRLSLAFGALGALALMASSLGVYVGWWEFPFGFQLLRWAVYLSLAAVVLALAAFIILLVRSQRSGMTVPGLALVLGVVAAAIPLREYRLAKSLPPINDITTDIDDSPEFAAAGRGAENGASGVAYPRADFAESQRAAYPDLESLRLPQPPVDAFEAALETARSMDGWEIARADAEAGAIEATVTTRWFRFKDDVVVRVRPAGSGSEVDVRSRSRVGQSDVGANAARIRAFRERLLSRLRAGD